MDNYVTGAAIRSQRESKGITQEDLANRIHVSAKAVSKWETGRGFPDISLLEPLAETLGISVIELLSGEAVQNSNRSANMLRSKFYICPVCGNVIIAAGNTLISCCGITLPAQEAEESDEDHHIRIDIVEDEYFVRVEHPMTKEHYITFLAAVSGDRVQLVRLYPEGNAEARFKTGSVRLLYAYCNRHGLFELKIHGCRAGGSVLRREGGGRDQIGGFPLLAEEGAMAQEPDN